MSDRKNSKPKEFYQNSNSLSVLNVISDSVIGYTFWCLIQAIGPMIWFYPLNDLEISGYEPFCLVLLSPIFIIGTFSLKLIQSRWVLFCLRLLMAFGLLSFQASSTFNRLVYLSVGCFFSMWVFTATLWSKSQIQRCLSFWGLILGYFAYLSSRVWYTSFVPAWWNDKSNTVIFTLCVVSSVSKLFTDNNFIDETSKHTSEQPKPLERPYWLPTSLGFASLLYLTHAVFGEVSLICRWVVRGYPHPGPSPYPMGACVLIALFIGVLLSEKRYFKRSFLWWIIGSLSFFGLYYLPTWWGFSAGIVLAVYVMSLWPTMVDLLTLCGPAYTLSTAAAVYLLQQFFLVWTVAYNFVPGGVYTRERTDLLIAYNCFTLGLALFMSPRTEKSFTAFFISNNKVKFPHKNIKFLLILTVLSGLAGFAFRFPHQNFSYPKKVESSSNFTAAIWTYHFGYDNKGWPSLERSAKFLNDTGADVITLLESDASKPFLGNNDLGMWLGEKLGMYVDFGVSTKDHTWGNLLLSKYLIVNSVHHMLPSPHGELAPAITATIDMGGGHLVDFVVTHMGNDRDRLDRKLQAEFLSKELKEAKNPVVFLGYVTSAPGSRDYKQLTVQGNVKDIDSTDKDRWCEYIMYNKLIRLGYARVSHGGLTDTELQMAKFGFQIDSHSIDNKKVTTDPSEVNPTLHFPKAFGKLKHGHNYVENHNYHMSTPKYFL